MVYPLYVGIRPKPCEVGISPKTDYVGIRPKITHSGVARVNISKYSQMTTYTTKIITLITNIILT